MRVSGLVLLAVTVFGCSNSGSTGSNSPAGSVAGTPAAGATSNNGGAAGSAVANAGASNGGVPSGGAPNASAGDTSAGAGGVANVGGVATSAGAGGAANAAGAGGVASAGQAGSSSQAGAASGGALSWAAIAAGTTWQWQLTGTLDKSFNVKVYDIDLYDNDAAAVTALHAKGAQVICYVSVGSWEDWRPDAADFPKAIIGKDYPGWPGEKFLDIRALDTLGPIIEKRMDLCKSKGFDGLEPDNMDVFEGGNAGTGFPLTEADGVTYAKWLTTQAHARGLSIGQKNTSELAAQLASVMDWALTEDCFDQMWCPDMQPFVQLGKAVLMSEYTDTGVNFGDACTWAKAHQYSAILKGRDLDAPVTFCP